MCQLPISPVPNFIFGATLVTIIKYLRINFHIISFLPGKQREKRDSPSSLFFPLALLRAKPVLCALALGLFKVFGRFGSSSENNKKKNTSDRLCFHSAIQIIPSQCFADEQGCLEQFSMSVQPSSQVNPCFLGLAVKMQK